MAMIARFLKIGSVWGLSNVLRVEGKGTSRARVQRIAIFDLDRTITLAPTFTPFLVFGAWRTNPWRVSLLPVWVVAMAGYRAGLWNRTALKRFGMRLMLGNPSPIVAVTIGQAFAGRRIAAGGIAPGASEALKRERTRGSRIVLATAAFEFYAEAFAEALAIKEVVATRWDGQQIPGGNCYGSEKLRRVREHLGELDRAATTVAFYSDSPADGPLFDWSDEAVLVSTGSRSAALADRRGWTLADWRT